MSPVSGVHLNGSLPLSTVEENMRYACKALSGRLKRLPDGEPGVRCNFTRWQIWKLQDYVKLVNSSPPEQQLLNGNFKKDQAEDGDRTDGSGITMPTAVGVDTTTTTTPLFETGYDDVAIESYQIFRKLKAEGVVPVGVRFMVALPTPVSAVTLAVPAELHAQIEVVYRDALLRALERIQREIPPSELAVQWDMPLEFMFLAGAPFAGARHRPWWDGPVLDGIIERVADLTGQVDESVEVGYHFCYGDSEYLEADNAKRGIKSRFFTEPEDTALMVTVANSLLSKCGRRISWISMPVPAYRTDTEYFRPLQDLDLSGQEGFDLVLGLVHESEVEGSRERIKAASEVVPVFHIASSCGLGRHTEDEMDAIFGAYNAVL
ncbi:hypothetical protein GE09DRAFT_1111257 [Coniochaeta sp. 2T2.1]|nr:hypothetical protein GE09DRAFT_1111257 [Coniochaeta sp. 2T2.1]